MKILYIYKDYKKRRKQYGEILEKLGNIVYFFEVKNKKEKNYIKEKHIKKYDIDLVWFYSPFYIENNKDVIDYLKNKKIPIVLYGQYNPGIPYPDWMSVWKKTDVLFVQNYEFNDYLRNNGINSHYIPFGFHPEQYYKTVDKKVYDISFAGTALIRDSFEEDKRAKYIRSLEKYNIHIFGETFKGKINKIPLSPYKTHKEQRTIYSQTKINLDLPFFCKKPSFYKDKYHIKNRFFEVPATRNFLLTARCPEFLNIFDEDTIGYYDDNIDSLKENVNKYLKDEKLREEMTVRSYKLVHEKHTFTHRFKEMLEILKEQL